MRMLTISVALLVATACATSPTGRRQLVLLPAGEVAALGVTAFEETKKNEPATTNVALANYVKCVSDAVLNANLQQIGSGWEVTTFASDQINAFALPGKKIGIYAGMAMFADNADQLAAVIGHEIGHVIAQHGNERMSQAMIAQGGLTLVDAWQGGGEAKTAIMAALGLGYDLGIAKPHSRGQESESDNIGLMYMAKAGFNPQQSVLLWQKMGARGEAGPEFLSTHPSPSSRANALAELQPRAAPLYQQAQSAGRKPNCRKP